MGRRRLPWDTRTNVLDMSMEYSPFTLNASLRLICTFVDESHSSNKGDKLVLGPTASFKACLAESHQIKRKAAVHGTRRDRSQELRLYGPLIRE